MNLKITVLSVGKLKEKYLKKGISEYLKRLKAYARVSVVEVEDEAHGRIRSDREVDMVLEKEAERILAALPDRAYVIALDIRGKTLSSEELAARLARLAVQGHSHVVFIIGGSLGLHQSVLQKADLRLSFGRFTYPHQLMRLILVEQIYRAFTINRGEQYHK